MTGERKDRENIMSEKKNNIAKNTEIIEITEDMLREKIYEFRGRKVMIDSDLAEIYGYNTKNFNRQVKNNNPKFQGDDFMFELTDEETEILSRCKNFTLNQKTGRGSNIKYNPHVFTEQGIYMLMTVLKGDLAIKQSRALVSTFKKMKDYILYNKELIGQRDVMQLSMQTTDNTIGIHKLRMDLNSVEKQMSDVMEQLDDVVSKSELADMMSGFVNDGDNGWLMYNTKYCSADVAYSSIYSQAKKTIYLIDNYIGLRTLVLLKNAPYGVDIKIFSDNIGSSKLHIVEYNDFCKEYHNIRFTMQRTGGVCHDRFIVLDYGTSNERVFLCGASSRDAGARITSIVEDFGIDKYDPLVKRLLKNGVLKLS
jgi:hypothetical protein